MEITEENTIEELCRQQKGNTNQSFAPEIFEIGMEHQSSKRLAQPSGGIYRRLSFRPTEPVFWQLRREHDCAGAC